MMTREEALKTVRELALSPKAYDAFKTLIPDFEEESEEEILKKGLIHHLKELSEWRVGTMSPIKTPEHYDAWIKYLEGIKEDKPNVAPVFLLPQNFEQKLNDCINIINTSGHVKSIRDHYVNFLESLRDANNQQVSDNYIKSIRDTLLDIEEHANETNGITEAGWAAIRAAHRLLGNYDKLLASYKQEISKPKDKQPKTEEKAKPHKFQKGDKITNGEETYTVYHVNHEGYAVEEADNVLIPFVYEHWWDLLEENKEPVNESGPSEKKTPNDFDVIWETEGMDEVLKPMDTPQANATKNLCEAWFDKGIRHGVESTLQKTMKWLDEYFYFHDNSSGRGEDYEILTNEFDSMEDMYRDLRKYAGKVYPLEKGWKPTAQQLNKLHRIAYGIPDDDDAKLLMEIHSELSKNL